MYSRTSEIVTIFVRVAHRRDSVLFRRGDAIPKEGAILEVFFPNDNALYSIAIWTHTKTAEPIDMPFWMKTRVGSRNDGGADSPSGRGNLRGLSGHSKALAIFAAAVAVTEIIQSPITSRSSRQKGSVSNQYDKQVQIVF